MKKTARRLSEWFQVSSGVATTGFAVLTFIWLLMLFGSCDHKPLYLDVPYVTTPDYVVDRMLEMAGVGPGDYVVDLGSGDGRIVIAAAGRGAFGHGVDIDPERIREARANARQAGVADRVMFLRENIFRTDISRASVVTMFLLTTINRQLRPRLFKQLTPGTRVVSHKFDMGDWHPDQTALVRGPQHVHQVYLWIMPAQLAGQWEWRLADHRYTLTIDQHFQEIAARMAAGRDSLQVERAILRGRRMQLTARDGSTRYEFNGRVDQDRIDGYVHLQTGDSTRVARWAAQRQASDGIR